MSLISTGPSAALPSVLQFLLVLSKILYASKNTLARLLVLVVSLGYSIVKPRLGGALKQVIAVGVSYFFFSCAYGVTHATGQVRGGGGGSHTLPLSSRIQLTFSHGYCCCLCRPSRNARKSQSS